MSKSVRTLTIPSLNRLPDGMKYSFGQAVQVVTSSGQLYEGFPDTPFMPFMPFNQPLQRLEQRQQPSNSRVSAVMDTSNGPNQELVSSLVVRTGWVPLPILPEWYTAYGQ